MKPCTAILFYMLALKCNKLPRINFCEEAMANAKKVECVSAHDASISSFAS
jgi:hypothetical protein